MNWNDPEHLCKTQGLTTQEKDTFADESYGDGNIYVVHNNRFGTEDTEFSRKVLEEEHTQTRATIVWDYDLVCGPGEEHVEIHISDKDDEAELLDGLIGKTEEALKLMRSRKAFLAKCRKPQEKKHGSRKKT